MTVVSTQTVRVMSSFNLQLNGLSLFANES